MDLLINDHLSPRHSHPAASAIDLSEPHSTGIKIHAVLQASVWGVLFPLGMVLGIKKSRFHVPVQAASMALTSAGYFLGHHHGGRQYPASFHGVLQNIIILLLLLQTTSGVYLKLHISRFQNIPHRIHAVAGRLFPLIGWTQILLGIQTYMGFCRGEEKLQCYAHHTFGVSFILYGALLAIAMSCGTSWMKRVGHSQELYDSLMIMTFGIINTFSMRHSDGWSHKDLQHTALGVLWWAGGSLGVLMSLGRKRNFVPAMVFIMTGYAFSGHVQRTMTATMVHQVLGISLAAAGVVRIIEICFVLGDRASGEGPGGRGVKGWQHLYPYLLVLVGCIFLSATDEELKLIDSQNVDAVTYMLLMFSLSFVIYLVITSLIKAYLSRTFGGPFPSSSSSSSPPSLFDSRSDSGVIFDSDSGSLERRMMDGRHPHLEEQDGDEEDAMEMEGLKRQRGYRPVDSTFLEDDDDDGDDDEEKDGETTRVGSRRQPLRT